MSKRYWDKYWLLHSSEVDTDGNPSTQNAPTYTGNYAVASGNVSALYSIVSHCSLASGLLIRGPGMTDQEGPDDYIATASAAVFFNVRLTAMLEYGKRNKFLGIFPYYYNNESPGLYQHPDGRWNLSAFFLRFPGLVCMIHYAAGAKPAWWMRLGLAVSLVLAAHKPPSVHDSWTQSAGIVRALRFRGLCKGLIGLAARYWERRKPRKTSEAWAEYCSNPEHPLAQAWRVIGD